MRWARPLRATTGPRRWLRHSKHKRPGLPLHLLSGRRKSFSATRALFSDQFLPKPVQSTGAGIARRQRSAPSISGAWLHAGGIRDRRLVNQVANLADVGWHENSVIGGRGPADYVPRLREKLDIDDDQWGRMCAEHALPLGWESMEYEEFLRERRRRMADIIRVAFRQLGGEQNAPPLTPPWFLPGAETVWQRIAETERALRRLVREVYAARFGGAAARKNRGRAA